MTGFSDPETAKRLETELRAAGNEHAEVFLYEKGDIEVAMQRTERTEG